mgnify:CR=1 FL=1
MKLGSVANLISVPDDVDPIIGRIEKARKHGMSVISVGSSCVSAEAAGSDPPAPPSEKRTSTRRSLTCSKSTAIRGSSSPASRMVP